MFDRIQHKLRPMFFPARIYLLNVNDRNTRAKCEMCSKLTIKTLELNFKHISHLVLVFLLSTLNLWFSAGIFLTSNMFLAFSQAMNFRQKRTNSIPSVLEAWKLSFQATIKLWRHLQMLLPPSHLTHAGCWN